MNVPRITRYFEAASQWIGIGLIILGFVYLPAKFSWIFAGCYVVFHLGFCMILSKFDDAHGARQQLVQDRIDKADNQIRAYCHDWVSNDHPGLTIEKIQRDRELLMLDWLEVNPGQTRVDFQKHFDHRLNRAIDVAMYSLPKDTA